MKKETIRLEMGKFPVDEVRLSTHTRYLEGTLEIDAAELEAMALQDNRIETANVQVVVPGEKARIFGIRDVVEPRIKVDGPGLVFPGILGPIQPVGQGKNHRLTGIRLMVSADYTWPVRTGKQFESSVVLDMWGPGAEASVYSNDVAIVLGLSLTPGLGERDAHVAMQLAEYKVARHLAETTRDLTSDHVEVFEVAGDVSPELPRVVLIQGVITFADDPPHSGIAYYGMPVRESLSTLLHPNELFDGAVTPYLVRRVGFWPPTYEWMNHPIARVLHREHGRSLNFLGVILERIRFETHEGKEIIALNTSQMAGMLEADGALISRLGGGNAMMDVMLTIRALEERGIKTVLTTYESPGPNGTDLPLLFTLPEADAIVTTGNLDEPLELPEPERVIGPAEHIRTAPDRLIGLASTPLSLSRGEYLGGGDNWGADSRTVYLY